MAPKLANTGAKTTRAFRTIGEASDELDLQPHVLRFWESKFSQIQPMKRGGGRRFYRPEDIEFIRGIKKLLHDEKHPIKDVQRLIKRNGAQSVVQLGRSVEQASRERAVQDVDFVPERISRTPAPSSGSQSGDSPMADAPSATTPVQAPASVVPDSVVTAAPSLQTTPEPIPTSQPVAAVRPIPDAAQVRSSLMKSVSFAPQIDRESLRSAIADIDALKARWAQFLTSPATA